MFLVGGPAFSGTTLLAHLLDQDGLVCLDEPDFHNPDQNHRSIPVLAQRFPDRSFPARPERKLGYRDAFRVIEQCQEVIRPVRLGVKTANWIFIHYARLYRKSGYPVIAIVRDIRDALVTPLPEWITERQLNKAYRLIWRNVSRFDFWCRYEDLVNNPAAALEEISRVLRHKVQIRHSWGREQVAEEMLKLDRHRLLQQGSIQTCRVGVWKQSGKVFSRMSHRTAAIMGYPG